MIVTHSNNTQEKWQAENLYRFHKLNATIKEVPYSLPFIDKVLNIVARYEAYSFLDGYLGYHQIVVASHSFVIVIFEAYNLCNLLVS
jgi:hypothetical protein